MGSKERDSISWRVSPPDYAFAALIASTAIINGKTPATMTWQFFSKYPLPAL